MKNLIIIGARGFGREVHYVATECKEYNTEWTIKGFLDDKADALVAHPGYAPILGSVENYEVQPDDVFCCALGDIKAKKKYIDLILAKGGVFTNIIHPSASVRPSLKAGRGLIVTFLSAISNDVKIGDFVTIQDHAAIGHDVVIGDWCVVNAFAFVGGSCTIGNSVTINPGSNIMPGKTVGDNAVVGIGSIVIRNVKADTTVFGNPAAAI